MLEKMNRLKVVFIIDNLNAGGAERVIRTLADEFDKTKFEVTLLLFNYDGTSKRKYSLPENINISILNVEKKRALFPLIKEIKKISPNIVMSTLAPVNILCVLAKILIHDKTIKFIIRETTIKSISINNTKNKMSEKFIYKMLIKIFYNIADSVIALSEGSRRDLISTFSVIPSHIKVIHNPLNIADIVKKSLEENPFKDVEGICLVCVGTLVKSKGHIYLIQAAEVLIKEYNLPIKVFFVGDGELKSSLYNKVLELSIEEDVKFLGHQDNPYKYVKNANIFVLPAIWEGFGNVIVEALACKTPVISSDCESGPKEIITDGVNGVLFQSQKIDSLVDSILKILENQEFKNNLISNGFIRAMEFDSQIIVRIYEDYFMSLYT